MPAAEVDKIVQDKPIADTRDTEVLATKVAQLYKKLQNSWIEDETYRERDIVIDEEDKSPNDIPLPSEAKRLSFYLADEIPLPNKERYKWLELTSTEERLKQQLEALKRLVLRHASPEVLFRE